MRWVNDSTKEGSETIECMQRSIFSTHPRPACLHTSREKKKKRIEKNRESSAEEIV